MNDDGKGSALDQVLEEKKRQASQERVGDALKFAANDQSANDVLERARYAKSINPLTQRKINNLTSVITQKQAELRVGAEARGFLRKSKDGEEFYDAGCVSRDNRPAETLLKQTVKRKHGPRR